MGQVIKNLKKIISATISSRKPINSCQQFYQNTLHNPVGWGKNGQTLPRKGTFFHRHDSCSQPDSMCLTRYATCGALLFILLLLGADFFTICFTGASTFLFLMTTCFSIFPKLFCSMATSALVKLASL
jgi:hypothetical protein